MILWIHETVIQTGIACKKNSFFKDLSNSACLWTRTRFAVKKIELVLVIRPPICWKCDFFLRFLRKNKNGIIIIIIIIIKHGWNENNHVSIQHINLYKLSEVTASIIKYTSILIVNCLQELIKNLLNLQLQTTIQ